MRTNQLVHPKQKLDLHTNFRRPVTNRTYARNTSTLQSLRPMPSRAATAKASICPQKQELADAFTATVRNVMTLQDRQLAAMIERDDGLDRFELAIKRAREMRDRAKRLYVFHVRTHGC